MQTANNLITTILVYKINSKNIQVSRREVSRYYAIFDNFSYKEKIRFIRLLSDNTHIPLDFFSLFISKIYEDNKSLLKYIDSDIIIKIKVGFPEFYFQFINFLYFSDYNFDTFENDFKNNKNTSTINFVKETIQHVSLIKNIESF